MARSDTKYSAPIRSSSSYTPLHTFRLSKDRSYQQQYGDMYFLRLTKIKPAVERIAIEAWGDTVIGGEPAKRVDRVLDVRQGELCWVVGTCYMDMPLKPNVLEDVTKDVSCAMAASPSPSFLARGVGEVLVLRSQAHAKILMRPHRDGSRPLYRPRSTSPARQKTKSCWRTTQAASA